MDLLQYSQKQYGVKQYGKYRGEETAAPDEASVLTFRKARIRARVKDGVTPWLIQHPPINIHGEQSFFRLQTNLGERILSQSITLPGKYKKVRLRQQDTQYISELQ